MRLDTYAKQLTAPRQEPHVRDFSRAEIERRYAHALQVIKASRLFALEPHRTIGGREYTVKLGVK